MGLDDAQLQVLLGGAGLDDPHALGDQRGQIEILADNLEGSRVQPAQVQDVVDQAQQHLSGILDDPDQLVRANAAGTAV